jgi:pimeloyl-ACP methyl ester carboxylesterase
LDRLVDDAAEVAQLIRARLSQRKLILVGQSWGSFLGVNVIKRYPDLFHAYIGTGQIVSFARTAAEQAQWARAQANKAQDKDTLAALDKAASLPQPGKGSAEAKASRKYLISPADNVYANMVHQFMGTNPRAAKGAVADWIAGAAFSGSKLEKTITALDLTTLGLDMVIPFFVVQGREDHIVGFEPAKSYAERIRAPTKAFAPIDGGHYACFTNPNAFVCFLRERVRPLAI